ncbi:Sulfite exporter TauE/SafE family protein 3 [Camellia lanceoleosa]|uniref:Sulfite exporter TauE/SafE family protein 3 n=1 Tax=Camellia lanceoleosa TaxID=1840588 RepID=A0ACC0FIB3_9ERIC|nr:Sulfite exporter TauE/SafE family protein 3 [Camellia lanceoleosa]
MGFLGWMDDGRRGEFFFKICMIMGAAISSVYYNLKLRHPTLNMPVIDYDLALLVQPMLMLGISIGVAFNVIFADWMVTVLLIILFVGNNLASKKEAAKLLGANGNGHEGAEYKLLYQVSIIENVYWKELGLLFFMSVAFLVLQITKNYTATCSTAYWVLNLLQIPVSVAVTLYEAIGLYKGKRQISSRGDTGTNWKAHQLILYCSCGVLAGVVGGLLGLGGGFILGPLFLELGVPPQVSSATATFAMTFSSSMSVVEYYLLKRFPVPYGGVGISNMIGKIEQHEYMGFEDLCKYDA